MAASIRISNEDFKGYRNPCFFKKTTLQQKRLQSKMLKHNLFATELIAFCKVNGLSICGITKEKKSDKIEVRTRNLNGDAIVFRITGENIMYKNLTNRGGWKKALIWDI